MASPINPGSSTFVMHYRMCPVTRQRGRAQTKGYGEALLVRGGEPPVLPGVPGFRRPQKLRPVVARREKRPARARDDPQATTGALPLPGTGANGAHAAFVPAITRKWRFGSASWRGISTSRPIAIPLSTNMSRKFDHEGDRARGTHLHSGAYPHCALQVTLPRI